MGLPIPSISCPEHRICIIIIVITQGLYLINRLRAGGTHPAFRIVRGNMDDGFPLHMLDRALPQVPIILILDEEANKHAGVHVLHMEVSQATGVAGIQFLYCILRWIMVVWEGGPRMVGV